MDGRTGTSPAGAQLSPLRARRPLWRQLLGHYLRETRREQERILTEVAARAGVSPQYLSEVERGLKEPSSEVLGAVVEALGCTLLDVAVGVAEQLVVAEVHELPLRPASAEEAHAASAPQPGVMLALAA